MDDRKFPEGSDTESVQFEQAEFGTDDDPLTCEFCRRSILESYYGVNGQTSCEPCRHRVEQMRPRGSWVGRVFRSLMAGGLGGAIGAGIYYAVMALTGYELGLIAIVVGLLVGFGVRWGSGGSGGRGYQVLAVAITYVAIVSTYIPFIVEGLQEGIEGEIAGDVEPGDSESASDESTGEAAEPADPQSALLDTGPSEEEAPAEGLTAEEAEELEALMDDNPVALLLVYAFGAVLVVLLALVAPFLALLEGAGNIVGLVIIGIALWEAWRVNAHQPFVVDGPFKIGEARASVFAPVE